MDTDVKLNICFLARRCYDKFSVAIANSLGNKVNNHKFYFITDDNKETRYVKEHSKDGEIFELPYYIQKYWESGTGEKLAELEKEYDCAPIWKYIYADRFLIYRDYDYCVRTTVALFLMYEEIFSCNQIDYYYSETIATLQCYIAYIVGKKMGVKYLAQMTARGSLESAYHYVLGDPYQDIINSPQFNSDNNIYSDDEIKVAEKILSDFEGRDIQPPNMVYTGNRPSFSLRFIKLIAIRIVKSFDKNMNNPYSYIYYKSYRRITDPVSYYFRYLRSKSFYKKADYSRRYVYFPLHYQPEASTIVCAQKYEKQMFFIDSWAKSLPADTVLYVKEHYAILGHRPIEFYKSLEQFPNVVLINPWESSRRLIENSLAVTTLTGTAGWEAMLLRKPVFLGGRVFYENAPGVIKVNDIFDAYLPLMKLWKQPEREDIVAYLCKLLRVMSPGNVYPENPETFEPDNMELITKSLLSAIVNNAVKMEV